MLDGKNLTAWMFKLWQRLWHQ